MNLKEIEHINNLLENSFCPICNTKMKEIKVPINNLPFDYLKFILMNKLKYLIVKCPFCKNQGIHTYK